MRKPYIIEMYGSIDPEIWWTWHIKTANGCVIAESPDHYSNRTVCRNVIDRLRGRFDCKFKEYKPGRIPVRSERE